MWIRAGYREWRELGNAIATNAQYMLQSRLLRKLKNVKPLKCQFHQENPFKKKKKLPPEHNWLVLSSN